MQFELTTGAADALREALQRDLDEATGNAEAVAIIEGIASGLDDVQVVVADDYAREYLRVLLVDVLLKESGHRETWGRLLDELADEECDEPTLRLEIPRAVRSLAYRWIGSAADDYRDPDDNAEEMLRHVAAGRALITTDTAGAWANELGSLVSEEAQEIDHRDAARLDLTARRARHLVTLAEMYASVVEFMDASRRAEYRRPLTA